MYAETQFDAGSWRLQRALVAPGRPLGQREHCLFSGLEVAGLFVEPSHFVGLSHRPGEGAGRYWTVSSALRGKISVAATSSHALASGDCCKAHPERQLRRECDARE